MKFIYKISFFVFLLAASFSLLAQDQGANVFGTIKDLKSGKRLSDAKAILKVNGTEISSSTTSGNGKYELFLELEKDYELVFSKKGYFAKIINIDLRDIPEEEKNQGVFQLNIEIELFEEIEDIDASLLQQPIGKSRFDPLRGSIEWDMDYTVKQQRKIQVLMKEYESKLAAERERNKKFDELISKAEAAAKTEDFDQAIAFYGQAKDLKPSKAEELDKDINEIKQQQKAIAESKAKEAEFQNLLQEAQTALSDAKFEIAEKKISAAIVIKPNDATAKTLKANIETAKSKDADFKKYVSAGDAAKQKEDFQSAVSNYELALKVFPDNSEVKEKLSGSKDLLEKQKNAAKLEENYNRLISEADALFGKNNFTAAIGKYKDAQELKPNEAYPKSKITEAEQKIEAQKQAEQLAEYEKLLDKAEKSLEKNNFDKAITEFEAAKETLPTDPRAPKRIEETKKLKADFLAKQDAEQTYASLISDADKLFSKKEYDEAKLKYQDATGIKPNEAHPKNRITEIEQIAKDNEAKFTNLVAAGDNFINQQKYDEAIAEYQKALNLKNSSAVSDKIKEAEAEKERAMALANLDEAYKALISKADLAFNVASFETAKENYNKAIGLKPNEDYPKNKLKEIDKKLAEIEEKNRKLATDAVDKEYSNFISKGDAFMSATKFESAIESYESALNIKPNDMVAIKKIKDAQAAIADKEKASGVKLYQEKIAQADKAFSDKKYFNAIGYYEDAQKLDASQSYPAQRIKQIQELIEKEERAKEQASTALEPKKVERPKPVINVNEASELEAEKFMAESYKSMKEQDLENNQAEKNSFLASREIFEDRKRQERAKAGNQIENQRDQNIPFSNRGQSNLDKNKASVENQRNWEQSRNQLELERQQLEVQNNLSVKNEIRENANSYNDNGNVSINNKSIIEQKRIIELEQETLADRAVRRRDNPNNEIEEYKSTTFADLNFKTEVKDQKTQIEEQTDRLYHNWKQGVEGTSINREVPLFMEKSADNLLVVNLQKSTGIETTENLYKRSRLFQQQSLADIQIEQNTLQTYAPKAEINQDNQRNSVELQKNAQQLNTSLIADKKREEALEKQESLRRETETLNQFQPARNPQLVEKYPQGVTEESYNEGNKVVIKRIVVKGNVADEYKKVIANWGTFYFKNDQPITETIWRKETKLLE
jgi:tetratricopeptide (TPR) repeat protein